MSSLEDRVGAFDLGPTRSSKHWKMLSCDVTNSDTIPFLMPVASKAPPPGSGDGLIPPILPRQGAKNALDLTQKQSFMLGYSASYIAFNSNENLSLSFYDSEISSDYRLLSFYLYFSSKKQLTKSLPVYSEVILFPFTFLLLSPGTSFFSSLAFPSTLTLGTEGELPGIVTWRAFTTPGTGAPITGPP